MNIAFLALALTIAPALLWSQSVYTPDIPKTWDEGALADWATPVAGLNVRPTHITSKEYYSLTIENLRTYPVYFPGREPEGYWEMLQHVAPKALVEPDKLKTKADWIEAGSRIFTEFDDLRLRTVDPKIVAAARSRTTFEAVGAQPLPDGTVTAFAGCRPNGVSPFRSKTAAVAIFFTCRMIRPSLGPLRLPVWHVTELSTPSPLIGPVHAASHAVTGVAPFIMGAHPLGTSLYQALVCRGNRAT